MKKSTAKPSSRFEQDEAILARYEALASGDDDERALSTIAEVVSNDSHPELHNALGDAVTQLGDSERAYALLVKAKAKNPNSGPLELQLGALAVGLDRSAEAVAHFQEAQRLGAETVDLYQLWGACEVALGNAEAATELFRTALELAPERVSEVYSAWGKALCDSGHSAQAKEKLTVAVAADENAFYPHAYLGVVHLQLGDPQAAERSFRRALAMLGDSQDAYAAWIVQELAAVVEAHSGGAAAAHVIVEHLQAGRRSLGLFEKLRRLQGIPIGATGKRYVLVLAGEDARGDFYEECEVEAEDEEMALGFLRSLHRPSEANKLVVANVRNTGRAHGPYAGVVDISDKSRVPELDDEGDNDDE